LGSPVGPWWLSLGNLCLPHPRKLQGESWSMGKVQSVCVFCGSSPGIDPDYRKAARELGQFLVSRGITLVYGGGKVGLMGEMARAALELHGRVIGVMPERLVERELVQEGLTELYVTDTMHARKSKMHQLADGYIALPGGYGTYEEIFETLSWLHIGIHEKPLGLLNVNGYFNPLLQMLAHTVKQGFARPDALSLIVTASDPESLLHRMERFKPERGDRWG